MSRRLVRRPLRWRRSTLPPIGTMFFYLVTRVGACGESIPGQDSGGHPNPNPAPCP